MEKLHKFVQGVMKQCGDKYFMIISTSKLEFALNSVGRYPTTYFVVTPYNHYSLFEGPSMLDNFGAFCYKMNEANRPKCSTP